MKTQPYAKKEMILPPLHDWGDNNGWYTIMYDEEYLHTWILNRYRDHKQLCARYRYLCCPKDHALEMKWKNSEGGMTRVGDSEHFNQIGIQRQATGTPAEFASRFDLFTWWVTHIATNGLSIWRLNQGRGIGTRMEWLVDSPVFPPFLHLHMLLHLMRQGWSWVIGNIDRYSRFDLFFYQKNDIHA